MEVKRIMRYLKGTDDFGLYYKRSENFELNAYTNADWGGNIDDRKKHQWRSTLLRKKISHLD